MAKLFLSLLFLSLLFLVGPGPTWAYCGLYGCEPDEDCSSCSVDCGSCPSPGTHKECVSGACSDVAGVGSDGCSTSVECAPPGGGGGYYCSGEEPCPGGIGTYRVVCDAPCNQVRNCTKEGCPPATVACVDPDTDCDPPHMIGSAGVCSAEYGHEVDCFKWGECGCADDCSPYCSASGECKYKGNGCSPAASPPPPPPPPPPTKTCTIGGISPSIATEPGSGTYSLNSLWFSGQGTAVNQNVRLFVERRDGLPFGTLTPCPNSTKPCPNLGTVTLSGGQSAYQLGSCKTSAVRPGTYTCSDSASVTLPVGTYYFHCDVPAVPGAQCSGNPFCSYESYGGTEDCTSAGWVSCSSSDNGPFEVKPAAATATITGRVFEDENSNGCYNTGETDVSGASIQLSQRNPYTGAWSDIGIIPSVPTYSFSSLNYYESELKVTALPAGLPCYTRVSVNDPATGPPTCTFSNPFSLTAQTTNRDIALDTRQPPWSNAQNGDIFSGTEITNLYNPIPKALADAGNPRAMSVADFSGAGTDAGGMVMAAGQITTTDTCDPGNNRSSFRGPTPGWQAPNVGAAGSPDKYLDSLPPIPTSGFSPPTNWTALNPNTTYSLDGNISGWPTFAYQVAGAGGIALVLVNGSVDITANLTSNRPAIDGLIIIARNDIAIDGAVTQIDAVLISKEGVININNPSAGGNAVATLIVNGGLYARSDVTVSRSFTPPLNETTPVMTVSFRPHYLTNTNRVFIKRNFQYQELAPQ